MCFIVNKRQRKVKIASKDIVCWKVGNIWDGEFHSQFQGFHYKRLNKYKINYCFKRKEYKIGYSLVIGFHSFISKKKAKSETTEFYANIGKFIIPKGSKYMKDNNWGEYISNQIIYKK